MAKHQHEMTEDDLQLCSHCGELTGRCKEDALYSRLLDDIERGPLCKSCFEMFEKERETLTKWSIK